MKVVEFSYGGRFAHFLRAEATANALTYPLPPRTVLLGLAGAILGLRKDSAQTLLATAKFAVGGPLPLRFWHKANMRKNLPAQLPRSIKKSDKGSSKAEKNTRIPQEWLWKPDYRVWAAFPESHHEEFAARIRERRWHFNPCLGLSEMLANVDWAADHDASHLPAGQHSVSSVVTLSTAEVNAQEVTEKNLGVHKIRMPRDVTRDRVFSHADYLLERDGLPIPVNTKAAWRVGNQSVMFL